MTGQFDPGETLTVNYLEKQFLTSAMPIREALRRLAAEGALEINRSGSARVPPISRERLADIIVARMTIEGPIAGLAASLLTKDEILKLELILERQADAGRREGIYGMLAANREFHFALYAGARSDVLLQVAENLWLRYGPYLRVLSHTQPPLRADKASLHVENHNLILKALKRRDGAAVQKAVIADIKDAQAILEQHCPWDSVPAPRPRPGRQGESGARTAADESHQQAIPRKRRAA